MSTRSFAQSISRLPASTHLQPCTQVVYRLACGPVIVLQRWWQAETGRRRRLRCTQELRALSDHTLRDIGVGRLGAEWVAPRDL